MEFPMEGIPIQKFNKNDAHRCVKGNIYVKNEQQLP